MADGISLSLSRKDENEGGWERSHLHRTLHEIYAVISGKIWIYEYGDHGLHVVELNPGQCHSVEPEVPHNIYTTPGTRLSVTKIPSREGASKDDWHPTKFLDEHLPPHPPGL